MNRNNSYKKIAKTRIQLYQEKLERNNNNIKWIFGNSFGRPGNGAPLRDHRGKVVSALKSITDENIYKYSPDNFSKGDNNIISINHKIFNLSNSDYDNVESNNYKLNDNFIRLLNKFYKNNLLNYY